MLDSGIDEIERVTSWTYIVTFHDTCWLKKSPAPDRDFTNIRCSVCSFRLVNTYFFYSDKFVTLMPNIGSKHECGCERRTNKVDRWNEARTSVCCRRL